MHEDTNRALSPSQLAIPVVSSLLFPSEGEAFLGWFPRDEQLEPANGLTGRLQVAGTSGSNHASANSEGQKGNF